MKFTDTKGYKQQREYMKFSIQYIESLRSKIKPVSHFETLAKDGFLNQYIEEFLYDKYQDDSEFRKEIMELQVQYSEVPVTEISKEYLKELSKSLEYFESKINPQ